MRSLTLVAAALLLTTSSPLAAQEAPVEPGARVRVTAPDLGINKYTGMLEGVEGDTLVVDTLRLPLASVTRLEVHSGQKSRAGRGALIGAAAGVVSGAIIGAVACSGSCLGEAGSRPAVGAALGAIALVLPGLLVGTVAGALIKTDRWEDVPLKRIRVGPTPEGGLAFVVSIRIAF